LAFGAVFAPAAIGRIRSRAPRVTINVFMDDLLMWLNWKRRLTANQHANGRVEAVAKKGELGKRRRTQAVGGQ
jgi:hypothetical protein